jgi:hypothetical protein
MSIETFRKIGSVAAKGLYAFGKKSLEVATDYGLPYGGVVGTVVDVVEGVFEFSSAKKALKLMEERTTIAVFSVSFWARCCSVDGKFSHEEDEVTNMLISSLFADDSLFPDSLLSDSGVDQEDCLKILVEKFNNPVPMEQIIAFLDCCSKEAAISFYEQACIIFAADGGMADEEVEFLNHFASKAALSEADKERIESSYLAVI